MDTPKSKDVKTIREEVAIFLDQHPILSKYTGEDYYTIEDSIVSLIEYITGTKDPTYDDKEPYGGYR